MQIEAHLIAENADRPDARAVGSVGPVIYHYSVYDTNVNHALVAANLIMALGSRLRGSGCRPVGSDLGVRNVEGAIRQPDVTHGPLYPFVLALAMGALGAKDSVVAGVSGVFEAANTSPSSANSAGSSGSPEHIRCAFGAAATMRICSG